MDLFMSLCGAAVLVDPPAGGVSPLAWVIITSLVTGMGIAGTILMKWISKMYADLKECNKAKAASEEEVVGLLRVLRTQMERSRGGR